MIATLDKEIETYRRELSMLLAEGEAGKFALVHQGDLDGVYPSFDAAACEGYARFGNEPFLAKEIVANEQPKYFSRKLRCR